MDTFLHAQPPEERYQQFLRCEAEENLKSALNLFIGNPDVLRSFATQIRDQLSRITITLLQATRRER